MAREKLSLGETFGIETTLAGKGALRLMRTALGRGFIVDLVYIGTADVEINLRRIARRVASGGHDVPESDVRRRYARSLAHLELALVLASGFVLIDNSDDLGFTILVKRDNSGTRTYQPLPPWAEKLALT